MTKLVRERGFDRGRIHLAGMSARAGLAARLAIAHPELFAAVGLHSGPAVAPPLSTMAAIERDAPRPARRPDISFEGGGASG